MRKTVPMVALIGRPNTGKSTLFNRLVGERFAITSPKAGTTRDRNYHKTEWNGFEFELIDTGGVHASEQANFDTDIRLQVELAIKEADMILFLVDAKNGLHPDDLVVARLLRKVKKNIILVANKADTLGIRQNTYGFVKLGMGNAWPASGTNGSGTGDLLDEMVTQLRTIKTKKRDHLKTTEKHIRIAFIGKPNVGKSSLVNAIFDEDIRIVSPIEHTTRDSVTLSWKYKDTVFEITDTAGLRRQNKAREHAEEVEHVSRQLAEEAIRHADVTVLVIDISQPISTQDKHLISLIQQANSGVILVANKWDLVKDKETNSVKKYTHELFKDFPFIMWVPILFVSAKEREKIHHILDTAIEIQANRSKEIPQKALDAFLKKMIAKHKPSRGGGVRHPRIFKLRQYHVNPPKFNISLGEKANLHDSYLRFLEKQLREAFNFAGTFIHISVNLEFDDEVRRDFTQDPDYFENTLKEENQKEDMSELESDDDILADPNHNIEVKPTVRKKSEATTDKKKPKKFKKQGKKNNNRPQGKTRNGRGR